MSGLIDGMCRHRINGQLAYSLINDSANCRYFQLPGVNTFFVSRCGSSFQGSDKSPNVDPLDQTRFVQVRLSIFEV